MEKYDLLPEQLAYEGTIKGENLFEPRFIDEEYILNTHTSAYWQRLNELQLSKAEIRRTGFPLTQNLVQREATIMDGTVQAAKFALSFGIGFNIAGGTHHAYADRGEGFCLLNDIAIGANYLLEQGLAKKILVIDLDVHQGNGTAKIFQNDPRVFTFSMHGEKNYPHLKEVSDWDVPLADHTNDSAYLGKLEKCLSKLGEMVLPDFVFYQAGVDVLDTDQLGRLSLTKSGCKERDRMVLNFCHTNELPVAVSMGGSYSKKIQDIIEAHANTFRLAQEIYF